MKENMLTTAIRFTQITLGIFGVVPRCRQLATKTRFQWYLTFDRMVRLPTY